MNSPSATRSFTGPMQSSPTFCHSGSPGDPIPTPGIFIISARTPPCAPAVAAPPKPPIAATAPKLAEPFNILRRLICAETIALYKSTFTDLPPS